MKFFEPAAIRSIIATQLEKADPGVQDSIYRLVDTVSEQSYAAGKREVQQGLVDVLELRQLLSR